MPPHSKRNSQYEVCHSFQWLIISVILALQVFKSCRCPKSHGTSFYNLHTSTLDTFMARFCSKLQIIWENGSWVNLNILLPLFQRSQDLYHLEYEVQGSLLLLLLFKDGVINQKRICSYLLWHIEFSHDMKKAVVWVFHLKSSTSSLYYA